MGCNCKTSGDNNVKETVKLSELSTKQKINLFLFYLAKTIGFLVGVALLPIINLGIIWFMFNTLVLTKEVDIKKIVSDLIGNKFNKKDDDEDDEDDDFENLTEDDVIMVDVEDITEEIK